MFKSLNRFPRYLSGRYGISVLVLSIAIVAAAVCQLNYLARELPEELEPVLSILSPPVVPEAMKLEEGKFRSKQTISEVLAGHGLSSSLVQQIIDSARPKYNLATIKAGYPYYLRFDSRRWFYDFKYPIDSEKYLIIYRDEGTRELVSEVRAFPFEVRVEEISAAIDSSLFQAIGNIGEKDILALDLEDIFSSEVDFYIDIRKGDSFKAIVEKKYLEGELKGYGAVLAASFVNDGRQITGFRFEDKNGKPAYYDAEGKSLKKSFLKSPLKFARISSRFSLARRHPITKKVQPHLGVDYAAPVGTPVRAVGSGKVVKAGRDGNNGNMVQLKHPKGYETLYLHLSKVLVKSGASVAQGELIGYVGSTGLSTGPHLDFRIRRNGAALNPLKLIFPPGDPVPQEKFEQFASVRDTWIQQLVSN